jgi:hypothetical protein
MTPPGEHPALERVLQRLGHPDVLDHLTALSGSDLTSLLLALMRRRAAAVEPAQVRREYERGRFVAPGQVGFHELRRAEDLCVDVVKHAFELVVLAPVTPFGAHACLGGISQDRLLSAIRGVEVSGDPTVGLVLQAAARRARALRHDSRATEPVRLAGIQRVLRAQAFSGRRSSSHFELLGLVSAGRDTGSVEFETSSITEHVSLLSAVIRGAGASDVVVRLTNFSGRHDQLLAAIEERLASMVRCERWDERDRGRGYYPSVCFKVDGWWGEEWIEIGDGGIVDWSQRLLDNEKERLVTSGASVERLATLMTAS